MHIEKKKNGKNAYREKEKMHIEIKKKEKCIER